LNELESSVSSAKDQLTTLTSQRNNLGDELKNLDSNVKSENEKIRKWERRLAEIRNQREYLALSREVEGSKRSVREAEEQMIELLAQKEDVEAKMESLQDHIAEDEVDRDAEREEVRGKIAELDAIIAAETERKNQLLHTVDKAVLRKYDWIREKRQGLGIVMAQGGSCQGCNMRLPPQLYNILQRVNSLEFCPSCQRILVYQGVFEQHA
jgi:hypothetical protein